MTPEEGTNLFESLPLSAAQETADYHLRLKASELFQAIEVLPSSREKSLAITRLEESLMWAVKGNSRSTR